LVGRRHALVLETNSGVPVIYEWGVDEQATSPGTSPGWSGDDIVLLEGRTIVRWTAAETRSLGLEAKDIVVAPGGQLIARLRGDSCPLFSGCDSRGGHTTPRDAAGSNETGCGRALDASGGCCRLTWPR
jgi:hypothetical protein